METSLGYTQISCFFHSHKITDQCKTLKTSFFFTDHNLQKLLSFIKTIEETLKKKQDKTESYLLFTGIAGEMLEMLSRKRL